MIRTRLSYGGGDLIINPQAISYIIRDRNNEITIAFNNGHTYNVTASMSELMEVLENEASETKCSCERNFEAI